MKTQSCMRSYGTRALSAGFSLIELLVALVLGTLVVLATTGIFISNKQSYNTTQSTSRIQENARSAFEMLSRELREAGANPCSRGLPMANVLRDKKSGDPLPGWWNNWNAPLQGYPNGAATPVAVAAGTDAVNIMYGQDYGVFVENHNPAAASFKANRTDGLQTDDLLMVCDYSQTAVFQATNVNAASGTIVHNPGSGLNCTKGLGLPVSCSGPAIGSGKAFPEGSRIARLQASLWYVAKNGRGDGTSLYRVQMLKGKVQDPEEIAEGVTNLQLSYLGPSGAGPAYQDSLTNYADATAVNVHMTIQDTQSTGTDNKPIVRQLMNVVSLRNRLP